MQYGICAIKLNCQFSENDGRHEKNATSTGSIN